MKKFALLTTLLALCLFLAGCQQGTETQSEEIAVSFIGGTNALSVDFVEGAPPAEVLDGARFPFNVNLEVKNLGEAEVKSGDIKIELSGINPADFGKQSTDLVKNSVSMDLYPARKTGEGDVLDGAVTYVDFANFNYQDELNGNVNFPIVADLCYKYQTRAVTKMCVRKDLLKSTVNGGDGCEVKGTKTVQNSCGPVHITSLSQFPTGSDKISFTLVIEKLGTGDVYKKTDSAPSCEDDIALQNKVYMNIDTGLGGGLSCDAFEDGSGNPTMTSSGYVTLYQGKRTITCVQTLTQTLDFEKVVDITMDYVYHEAKSKSILVKHPLG
ncbi:hypothetical protein JXM83_06650 [Candidatus Woesearchaeota archaeon]|nr:hypothetical protein [Candidatus Woesearchaeota archaeon]